MARQWYETAADLLREREVADRIEKLYNVKAIKVSPYAGYDFDLLRDNKVVARIEVKCRTVKSTAYRTFIIATQKVNKLVKMKEKDGVPTLLVIRWTDRIGILGLPHQHKVVMGGRKDRNDKFDQETMAEFVINDFKFVK